MVSNRGLISTTYRFLFNMTATPMLNSSVHLPYGMWDRRDSSLDGPFYSPKKKKYMAFIAFSNCHSTSNRSAKVAELQRYMEVHVYGSCGNRSLKRDDNVWQNVSAQYRFYLSFENAFCREYITEKFHRNGLESQAVPVVFGGLSRRDYEWVSPPNSFIYALDFPKMRELAEHLKSLAADEARYAGYLQWKRYFMPSPRSSLLCGLCRRLHRERGAMGGIVDLKHFYDSERNCRPKDYRYLL